LVANQVLVEELGLNYFRNTDSELSLPPWNQALDGPLEDRDRLARAKQHLDGEAVGQPADACPDEGEGHQQEDILP
jgi:hypothetical protein